MRRRTLISRGALLGALAVAGCIGSPGGEATTQPEPTDPPETDSPTPSPTATDADTPTPSPANGDGADQAVTVGPDGSLRFDPSAFEIGVGDTVLWQFDSGGHNVRPNAMPDGADWPGTEGGDSTTYGADHTYTYTFEVAGSYEYYCAPHRSAGMTGTFTVG